MSSSYEQAHHWEPDVFKTRPTATSKLEGSHQQGSHEDRDRMGRGTPYQRQRRTGEAGGFVSPNAS